MSKIYNVDTPINHDGESYHPETDNTTIKLSDKQAEPLLAVAAISVIEDEATDTDSKPEDKNSNVVPINNTAPEDKQQQLDDIQRAINGLATDDEANWTKNKKADTKVLSQLLGWKVTAALRDEAASVLS
ncbi:MAG: hypothetical protein COA63_010735 [Methylophaga sp.]|nr:hypothetical protein [Methylophaga sp.]